MPSNCFGDLLGVAHLEIALPIYIDEEPNAATFLCGVAICFVKLLPP